MNETASPAQPHPSDGSPRIYSVGHSNRSIRTFLRLLEPHGVRALVDIRSVPRSRHNPQFNAGDLEIAIGRCGILYRALPQLGGLRRLRPDSPNRALRHPGFRAYADHMETREFAAGIEDLLVIARHATTAFMCAEADPRRCHRSLLSDALFARGQEVVHILDHERIEIHRLTPDARIVGSRPSYREDQASLFTD